MSNRRPHSIETPNLMLPQDTDADACEGSASKSSAQTLELSYPDWLRPSDLATLEPRGSHTGQAFATWNPAAYYQPPLNFGMYGGFSNLDTTVGFELSHDPDITGFTLPDLEITDNVFGPSNNVLLSNYHPPDTSFTTAYGTFHNDRHTPATGSFVAPPLSQPGFPASLPLPRQHSLAALPARKAEVSVDEDRIRCRMGCRATFRRPGDYRRHMLKHEAPKYQCHFNHCDKKFYRLDKMHDHAKRIHEKKF